MKRILIAAVIAVSPFILFVSLGVGIAITFESCCVTTQLFSKQPIIKRK